MRTLYLSSAMEQSLLLVFLFLTLIWSLFLLLTAFGRYGNKRRGYLHVAVFVFLLLFLCSLTGTFAFISGRSPEYTRMFPAPMWLLWCIGGGTVIFLCWESVSLYRLKRQRLDRNSIKQAMDLLPEGICYFTSNGIVKLCNLQMYRLFHTLAGKDLQKLSELQEALQGCDEKTEIVSLPDVKQTYLFPDGKVWRYRQNEVSDAEGNTYTEAVFSDLTEQYHKNLELKRQTEKLKEISRELRRLSDNVLILTKEKEVLTAKTKLHDQMGAGLTAVRQILQHPEAAEAAKKANAVKLLRQAVSAVKNDNEYPPEQGEFAKFMQDAGTIGVNVKLSGTLPEDEELSRVFILAMRECLTNSVRHAAATELVIKIEEENGHSTIFITNNGTPPEREIVPKGGLQNLYRYVLDFGGRMEIVSKPFFVLTVTIPTGKEENE